MPIFRFAHITSFTHTPLYSNRGEKKFDWCVSKGLNFTSQNPVVIRPYLYPCQHLSAFGSDRQLHASELLSFTYVVRVWQEYVVGSGDASLAGVLFQRHCGHIARILAEYVPSVPCLHSLDLQAGQVVLLQSVVAP